MNEESLIRVGAVSVDLVKGHVFAPDRVTQLTPREQDLLGFLVDRANAVVPQDLIIREVWGHAARQTLYANVARLRNKLGDDTVVETVYGEGVRLVLQQAAQWRSFAPLFWPRVRVGRRSVGVRVSGVWGGGPAWACGGWQDQTGTGSGG